MDAKLDATVMTTVAACPVLLPMFEVCCCINLHCHSHEGKHGYRNEGKHGYGNDVSLVPV